MRYLETARIIELVEEFRGVTTELVEVGGGVTWIHARYGFVEAYVGPHVPVDGRLMCETGEVTVWTYDAESPDDEIVLWASGDSGGDSDTEQTVADAVMLHLSGGTVHERP